MRDLDGYPSVIIQRLSCTDIRGAGVEMTLGGRKSMLSGADYVQKKVNGLVDMWRTCVQMTCSNGFKIKHTVLTVSEVLVPLCPWTQRWQIHTYELPAHITATHSNAVTCTQSSGGLRQLTWTCTYNQPLLRRNYLQAVPCDPAGADFNFAALSFNSEFLHQIQLIPLHGCSRAQTQAIFALSAAENVAGGLRGKRLAG